MPHPKEKSLCKKVSRHSRLSINSAAGNLKKLSLDMKALTCIITPITILLKSLKIIVFNKSKQQTGFEIPLTLTSGKAASIHLYRKPKRGVTRTEDWAGFYA